MNTSLVSDVLRLPDMEKVSLIQQLLESLKSSSISSISETKKIELEKMKLDFIKARYASAKLEQQSHQLANGAEFVNQLIDELQ